MNKTPAAAIPLALYVVVPAVGVVCGFVGTFAASTSLGALWLVLGPLAAAGLSGGLGRLIGRDGIRTIFIALLVAALMIVAGLALLLAHALGQLPSGFHES